MKMFTRSRRVVQTTHAVSNVQQNIENNNTTSIVNGGDNINTCVVVQEEDNIILNNNNNTTSVTVVVSSEEYKPVVVSTASPYGPPYPYYKPPPPTTLDLLRPFSPDEFIPDTPTITNILLSTLDGVQCGVPTLTTPTLTPTTLRNIQQTFLQASAASQVQPPEHHTNQAGFVPPIIHPQPGSTFISIDSKSLGGGIATLVDTSTFHLSDQPLSSSSLILPTTSSTGGSGPLPPLLPISGLLSSNNSVPIPGPTAATSSGSSSIVAVPRASDSPMPSVSITVTSSDSETTMLNLDAPPSRRMGGRRPNKYEKVSDEEDQKRLVRRERNKMAAARCRKRRLDQTMTLQEETDMLESKRGDIQNEIQLLKQQKDELEFLLKHHKRDCNRVVGSNSSAVIVTSGNQQSSQSILPQNTSFSDLVGKNNNMVTNNSNMISKGSNMISKTSNLVNNNFHVKNSNMIGKKLPIIKRELTPPLPIISHITVKEEHLSDADEYNPPDIPVTLTTMPSRVASAQAFSTASLLIGGHSNTTTSGYLYNRVVTVHSSSKPNRPTTLNVGPLTDIGVSIETPSAGIRGLNFESMMEGGTGLTPVTPLAASMVSLATGLTPLTTPIMAHPSASVTSCSSIVVTSANANCAQQVSSASDMSSPDSIGSKHLVSL